MPTVRPAVGDEVRDKLQTAPWWVWSLILGAFFGSWMTVFNHLQQGGSWTAAIVGGLFGGVFFGAVMGPFVVRQRRRVSAVAGDLSARDLRAAARVVNRGRAPLDPEIRRAAARLATQQLKQLSRFRRPAVALFGLLALSSAAVALTSSPWFWLAAALHTGFAALYLLWPRHLQRRIEILTSGTADPVSAS